MKIFLLTLAALAALTLSVDAKIFSRCEFVRKMSKTFYRSRVRTWNCIVSDLTGYNSAYQGTIEGGLREFGIFSFVENAECTVINQTNFRQLQSKTKTNHFFARLEDVVDFVISTATVA
jgi:hypothetical protein